MIRISIHSWIPILVLLLILGFSFSSCENDQANNTISLDKGAHVVLLGNNLCSRMMNYGHFETALHLRYPDHELFIRNMCDGGNTPAFRPHSGRNTPWPFPGAKTLQSEYANDSGSEGHFAYPDEWLTTLATDVIMAFFGFNESFDGPEGLQKFKDELHSFIIHTRYQKYNGESAPKLILVSPIAFENLSSQMDLPNGKKENQNLRMYTKAMREIAAQEHIPFIDAFTSSQKWFSSSDAHTIDGSQMNESGYQKFSKFLVESAFSNGKPASIDYNKVKEAVLEKNWFWHNDYKIPNGVHVFGRRFEPFGPDNYPAELEKTRQMTAIRDTLIWKTLQGAKMNLVASDGRTLALPEVETNYALGDYGGGKDSYLYGEEALKKIFTAPGYKIELFASEKEFPDLANPVQLSFDNKGRLWVATMPTYPHYRPGDPRPDDKLIILEDTDNDGKADKQTIFADGLHLPVGFEFAPEGVYVSQGTNLKLLIDSNSDDRADKEEIIFSGFDDHDTHHVISAFCADPSGALYMSEGVFLHTNVETSYGPVRATNGGFYRFNPMRRHLERTAQLSIPNPWGIAFDDWGQQLFAETSGPAVRWMMPGTVKSRYGIATHKGFDLIDTEHKVRPTSGLEFVSSRHFPQEVQGDMLINNTIGFLGMKQHQVEDDGTGYDLTFRHDLIWSDDGNFRPVDMEFAPDGSLYLVDWHNVLIGHMQHNARDPLRDHVHGRIYRITYPSRALVTPAKVHDATIAELLDNLKLPEYRTRYRTRRELRGRDKSAVLSALSEWITNLNKDDPNYEHHKLEALWVTWGLNDVDQDLLRQLLKAEDFRARTAAVRVLRYSGHQVSDQATLLKKAASDPHGRVRLEAIVAASWLPMDSGLDILEEAEKHELDEWMIEAFKTSKAHLQGVNLKDIEDEIIATNLTGVDRIAYLKGKEIFEKDGFCGTCHQLDGQGLDATGYPPLAGTKWVLGDPDRLIKLTLKGLYGPITVLEKDYPGIVPMTPYEGLLNDEELASVLTYVRNSFGNKASVVAPDQVKEIRALVAEKEGFYTPEELLKEHPLK